MLVTTVVKKNTGEEYLMCNICAACIGEPVLRMLVSAVSSSSNPCDYCDVGLPAIEIGFVAGKCDGVLSTFYTPSHLTAAVIRNMYSSGHAAVDHRMNVFEVREIGRLIFGRTPL